MKKRNTIKNILIVVFIIIVICAIINIYNWITFGNQNIKISTSAKAYTESDLYVSVLSQKNGEELETKSSVELLDENGKSVKDSKVKYEGNTAIISIPNIEPGKYILEVNASSSAGRDTVRKEIYISNGNSEHATITFDKGIYKPGDKVNFRALLTLKENDKPISKEANISIYDGNNNKVYNENVKTSDYGIVSGTFQLAEQVNSGIYKLVVKTDSNETTKQFKVNPYVLPKYEVKIDKDKESYIVGDTAFIELKADYFFGEPVSNVKYNLYIDGKAYPTTADENGYAKLEYKLNTAKTYSIKVEAVDSSNYFVEAETSITAGTDIFEVSIVSEFGTLAMGRRNRLYVITNKADGTPVKTYVTINNGEFMKQVATDENGIGQFAIDIDNSMRDVEFNIVAQNMDGEVVKKDMVMTAEHISLLLSTDKAKYNQGDDIEFSIISDRDITRDVYFFKNDKIIKIVSTNTLSNKVNLGDIYGLVDVLVKEYNNTFKRTIFIKPSKQLNVDIETDKDEYRPGENIKISFETTNENNENADSALLVSMLDNAILNLASNDLSIDSIKLALQDINFSSELDAATLYTCIVDDMSEHTIMALLLKQGNKDAIISTSNITNIDGKEQAATISIILIIVIVIMIIIGLFIKYPKFRKTPGHVANLVVFVGFMLVISLEVVRMHRYYYRDINYWLLSGIVFLFTTAIYILIISKRSKYFTRTSVSIIITLLLYIAVAGIISEFDTNVLPGLAIVAVLFLLLAILARTHSDKDTKFGRAMKVIEREVVYIFKYAGAMLCAIAISEILMWCFQTEILSFIMFFIAIYFFNMKINKLGGATNKIKIDEEKKEQIAFWVFAILIALGFLTLGNIGIMVINGSSGMITNSFDQASSSIKGDADIWLDSVESTNSSSSGSGWGSVESFFGTISSSSSNNKEETNARPQEAEKTNETEVSVDENIRNVFLESMCFVPELITTNGKAELELKLSDNITTWTIQTIGNTKNGQVGYGALDNIKVFKEFFVDFELPTNSIEEDKVSIPVTVFNYTDNTLRATLNVKEDEWFNLNTGNNITIQVDANGSNMVYIPITILQAGNNKFRIEAVGDNLTDIIEKNINVSIKGQKIEKVVSTGNLDEDISEDILILEDIIKNTGKAKVKIYATPISQVIEGMDSIFRMPTGCFEQISSTLYPNILALKYMEDNKLIDEELKQKALGYITSGYQKILTYEVKGESGGFSLYGSSPAETVLTAYGLMELSDLKEVYQIDNNVTERMEKFLYNKQKSDGSFTITGYHLGGAGTYEDLALNAYITWALSEANPFNEKISKSVSYLKGKLNDISDNYTLALIANVLANVKDSEANNVIKRIVNNIQLEDNKAYITSNVVDYYGSRGNVQTIQTVALTSMALSKTGNNTSTNKQLINYLISKKGTYGAWYSTQATILALRALNELRDKEQLQNQTVTVRVNSDERKIEIKDNPLEYYELIFEGLGKENKLDIDIERGSAYYEVITEYYIPYENVDVSNDNINVSVKNNTAEELKVNDILDTTVQLINNSKNAIYNGMVVVSIPQGFKVEEDSLMLLEQKGFIEKYEYNYSTINIYLRNFDKNEMANLNIKFRASYPVEISGLGVQAYDYYNPEISGKSLPINIVVK